jgi:hypothetical protein
MKTKFLFLFKEDGFTKMVYVEAETELQAEQKVYDKGYTGWYKVIVLSYDLQVFKMR